MLPLGQKLNFFLSRFTFVLCAWHSRVFACSLLYIVLYMTSFLHAQWGGLLQKQGTIRALQENLTNMRSDSANTRR